MKKSLLIITVVVTGFLFSGCGYNTMVSMDEAVSSAWAQVENVYQRRADLIPNLVETVKGYAEHEQETFTRVIEARAKATSMTVDPANLTPEALQQFQEAQQGLTSALNRLMVVVEQYPDLKANQNFLDLQAQLEGTENRITVERMKFNEATQGYNAYIRRFPELIIAKIFGFKRKAYFEAQPGAEKAPEVKF
ncbi:MAG: LemA family protein [Prolixibacteraceae bacterium]|jgi:LemA protein|nr:LemA family protein [Prolixibacteraceae bacterium]MDI9563306.1 LemA family protein [Bacteroidota bacterium]NLS98640.1 LemA family protein [Bacteroidales bacterium]OQB80367.1 MAG: LemA family protein [Bacteroidetes bacterium ADurb.Bin123]HNZ68456.1 LemA family protein [Prolixibacteraceae bacterium]